MILTRGSKGLEVTKLQTNLKALGFYKYPIDGRFGPVTLTAVRTFQQRYLVDGIVDEVSESAIEKAMLAWGENPVGPWIPPSGLAEIEERFGHIEYRDIQDGRIEITNNWEDGYLVEVDLPIVGKHRVNKNVSNVLTDIMQCIKDRGLDQLIKQFWCWTPRHKMWKPNRNLSTHSWAAAVDINWGSNPVGRIGDLDPGIVSVFEQAGANWGGRWQQSRDDMHFQFCTGW